MLPSSGEAELLPMSSVTEALDAVLSGLAMRAVAPIENSLEGGRQRHLRCTCNNPGCSDLW
ncbi:hypothetical protein N8885_00475 [Aquiluna sp.]|nr:hypothetical protein [Aquiluna sp.]